MPTLILMEFKKMKRSKILYIVICTMFLFYLCAAMQGIRSKYDANRLLSETLTYATYFIVPALYSLIGSYMLSREYLDDTMKSNMIIPVDVEKMTYAKLAACLIIGIIMFFVLFVFTIVSALFVNADQVTLHLFLSYLKIYLLHAISCFIATLPIIVVMPMFKNGFWLSVVFAEIYSFAGLVVAGSHFRMIYPVTAAFGFSGANNTTKCEFVVCCFSLLISAVIALIILKIERGIRRKQ